MFIKIVYSYIDQRGMQLRSISSSKYAVEYRPGEWTEPKLPGSRLFVYENLMYAQMSHRFVTFKEIPYAGVTWWWADAADARKVIGIKDPPAHLIERYWVNWNMGIDLAKVKDNAQVPWFYRWKDAPAGLRVATRVRLRNMVMEEDFESIPHFEPIFIY